MLVLAFFFGFFFINFVWSLSPNPVKTRAAWAAEKLGRLKLNGRLLRRSPLSLVEDLEVLQLGVEGKLAIWRALRQVQHCDRRLGDIDLERLIERATKQRDHLERLRLEVAAEALSGGSLAAARRKRKGPGTSPSPLRRRPVLRLQLQDVQAVVPVTGRSPGAVKPHARHRTSSGQQWLFGEPAGPRRA
jgi:hypothetical protein